MALDQNNSHKKRTPGVKPAKPGERAEQILVAIRLLERIGSPFAVADVAERAGVSRATIYRHRELRDLIGAKGDGARHVDKGAHDRLSAQHQTLKSKNRDIKNRLAETERGWEEMRERALEAERRLKAAERRIETLSKQLAAIDDPSHTASMGKIVTHFGQDAVRRARRQLVRALHPDLFAKDPAAAALATELLKTLNALAE